MRFHLFGIQLNHVVLSWQAKAIKVTSTDSLTSMTYQYASPISTYIVHYLYMYFCFILIFLQEKAEELSNTFSQEKQ
jgi:hypothetical protein